MTEPTNYPGNNSNFKWVILLLICAIVCGTAVYIYNGNRANVVPAAKVMATAPVEDTSDLQRCLDYLIPDAEDQQMGFTAFNSNIRPALVETEVIVDESVLPASAIRESISEGAFHQNCMQVPTFVSVFRECARLNKGFQLVFTSQSGENIDKLFIPVSEIKVMLSKIDGQ